MYAIIQKIYEKIIDISTKEKRNKKNDKVVEPKNLEIFVVGNDMYDKIKENEEER